MTLRKKMLVSLFAALLSVSSYIIIPLGPMPVTLQVLFVLLAGAVLGAKLGPMSVLVWIALGVFGLPVFAGGKAGPIALLGPTGGYLLGFVLCAWTVGAMTRNGCASKLRTAAAMLLGISLMYIVGLVGFMASFTFFFAETHDVAASFVDRGTALYTGRPGQSGPWRLGVADPDWRPQPGRNHGAVAGAAMMRLDIGADVTEYSASRE